MTTNLRMRQQRKRVFQLSGFADAERKEMGRLITALGGIDFDSQNFRSNCTHVVCKKLSRSEKFLGGCATAKWVLHPDYVRESAKVGQWLQEDVYDWSQIATEDGDDVSVEMKEASRRWRYHLEVFGTTAFVGWKTALVVSGAKKHSVYKSLLHSGGADVYNLKLPVTQPEKVTSTLTYIFANDKFAPHIAHLIDYGVLCLRPDYIGDYLIKDPPPDPLDYLVKVPIDTSLNCSQASDLDFSQLDTPSSSQHTPEKNYLSFPSSASNSPFAVNRILSQPNSTASNTSVKPVLVIPPLSDRVTRNGSRVVSPVPTEVGTSVNRIVSQPNSAGSSPTVKPVKVLPPLSDIVTQNGSGVVSPVPTEVDTPGQSHPVQISRVSQKKRKISEVVGVENALQQLKKLRVSKRRFIWKSCVVTKTEAVGQQQTMCVAMEFTNSMTNIIHSCLEEDTPTSDFLSGTLDFIVSMISTRKYPKAVTVHMIMVKLLQEASSDSLSNKAYQALMHLLQVHPPTSPTFTDFYMQALTVPLTTTDIDLPSHTWHFIRSVIQKIIDTPWSDNSSMSDGSTRSLNSNILLLKFIVAVLEQNFRVYLQRYVSNEVSVQKLPPCMISRVLWPGMGPFSINNKCRDLLSSLSNCLSSQLDLLHKIQVLPLLLNLISMAAECCRLTEYVPGYMTGGLPTPTQHRTLVFVHELARNIDVTHEQLLAMILRSLQPAWLCLSVCLLLLNNMDDYLVLEGVRRDVLEVSLQTIVHKYFFMLPNIQPGNGPSTVRANTPITSRKKIEKENLNDGSDCKENKITMDMASKANKRNMKGETALHRACIKNDVIHLRKLLKVPGVDVNAQDNAGWTPLHEACNHGNMPCVKELLNFVPAKTVDTFFIKGENKCRKADLLLSNHDGITPLHDAVMNDRLDVCRLLLQHGGRALMRCRTIYNYTPQDLATTENVRNLLYSFESDENSNSSQGSDCVRDGDLPSDYLYDQVLRQDGSQQLSNRQDCANYICLVSLLVKSYLEVGNVRTLVSLCTGAQDHGGGGVVLPTDGQTHGSEDEASATGHVASVTNTCGHSGTISHPDGNHRDDVKDTDSDIVGTVQSDMKVVKKLKIFVQRFEDHIMKISHPDDHTSLKSQIMCLWCLAETCSDCNVS